MILLLDDEIYLRGLERKHCHHHNAEEVKGTLIEELHASMIQLMAEALWFTHTPPN